MKFNTGREEIAKKTNVKARLDQHTKKSHGCNRGSTMELTKARQRE